MTIEYSVTDENFIDFIEAKMREEIESCKAEGEEITVQMAQTDFIGYASRMASEAAKRVEA